MSRMDKFTEKNTNKKDDRIENRFKFYRFNGTEKILEIWNNNMQRGCRIKANKFNM